MDATWNVTAGEAEARAAESREGRGRPGTRYLGKPPEAAQPADGPEGPASDRGRGPRAAQVEAATDKVEEVRDGLRPRGESGLAEEGGEGAGQPHPRADIARDEGIRLGSAT